MRATDATEMDAQVSPDGRSLAYSEGGQVYVARFPDLPPRQHVSTVGGRSPVWSGDGRELFYVRGKKPLWAGQEDEELFAHAVAPDGTISLKAQPLFRLAPVGALATMAVPGYDVTRDGKRFLFVLQPEGPLEPLPHRITIVQNWVEELRARVPRQ